jgi:hypothetical protein
MEDRSDHIHRDISLTPVRLEDGDSPLREGRVDEQNCTPTALCGSFIGVAGAGIEPARLCSLTKSFSRL